MRNDVKNKTLYRDVKFSRETANADARTVELAFSSEEPVERWFGVEILGHGKGNVRLERLGDSGPVLVDHNTRDVVGVVETVRIDNDKVGRALVRFGKSARASEIFQDVTDGIRGKVSVGYMVHAMELESKEEEVSTYRITDWEPLEISIVAVPADATVGVGRSAEPTPTNPTIIPETRKENIDMTAVNTPTAPAAAATPVNADVLRDEVRNSEIARIRDLTAIGKQFERNGGVTMAQSFINSGKSVDEFRAALITELGKAPVPSAEIGLTDPEIRQFSFMRAVNALANPKDARAQEAAAFEMEVSRAAATKQTKEVRGILVPIDVLRAPIIPMSQRDLTKGVSTAGGHLVGTDLLAGSFIDLLRNKMVLQRLGITTLNGLVGNIALSRQTSGATAYWVAESGNVTESQQAFDQVTLSPKTIGALTDVSRKLLIQSSVDVENLVKRDLATQIAIELDRVGLYGSGSANQPLGIKDTTGINTKDFGADAPTWAEIVALETLVADDNADIGSLAYLVNPTGRGALKTTEKASSTGQFIWEQGNTVNGYRTEVSKQIATNDFWFGNWSDVIMGVWSGIDMIVDPFTASASATVRVVCHQDIDIAVRHPESFCRGNNTL